MKISSELQWLFNDTAELYHKINSDKASKLSNEAIDKITNLVNNALVIFDDDISNEVEEVVEEEIEDIEVDWTDSGNVFIVVDDPTDQLQSGDYVEVIEPLEHVVGYYTPEIDQVGFSAHVNHSNEVVELMYDPGTVIKVKNFTEG